MWVKKIMIESVDRKDGGWGQFFYFLYQCVYIYIINAYSICFYIKFLARATYVCAYFNVVWCTTNEFGVFHLYARGIYRVLIWPLLVKKKLEREIKRLLYFVQSFD